MTRKRKSKKIEPEKAVEPQAEVKTEIEAEKTNTNPNKFIEGKYCQKCQRTKPQSEFACEGATVCRDCAGEMIERYIKTGRFFA